MRKLIKITLMLIVVITFFVGGAITLLVTKVSQDTIKNKVAQIASDKTGKKLVINGAVQWSFFPWFGIKIKDVTLESAANSKNSDFAHVGELSFSVKLLPLILGRIAVGDLTMKDLSMLLTKDNSVVYSWQGLSVSNNVVGQKSLVDRNTFSLAKLTIDNVSVENGQIFWQDQRTNKKFEISKLDLHCKNINFSKLFEIKSGFYLGNPDLGLSGQIRVDAQVKLDVADKLYVVKNLQLAGRLTNKALVQPLDFESDANAEIDLNRQTLIVEKFQLRTNNARATGTIRGNNIIDAPSFTGNLAFDSSHLKVLLQAFGVNSLSQNWSNATLKTGFEITPKFVQLAALEAVFGDMMLHGDARYAYAGDRDATFSFSINKLNADALLPAATIVTSSQSGSKSSASFGTSFDFLRTLKLAGDLRIDALQIKKTNINNFSTKIIGSSGLINCQNIKFDFYHGHANGNVDFDVRSLTPQVNLRFVLDNVAMQPLLMDVAKYSKLSGVLTLDADISMHGATYEAMLNSMIGSGNVLISGGSYLGIDVPYEVRHASAILNQKPMPKKTQLPHTEFERLTASFRINNAFLRTNDFLIQASDYKVTGEGGANLVSQALDLKLSAYSTHDAGFFVPIKITGVFADPSIKPDVAIMARQLIKKEINKQLGRINIPQELIKVLPLDKLI